MDTYYLKSLIFDLTILEYEMLCVALPNYNKHRLIKKAFKKTNSLRKIQLLSKKYKGDVYYKQHKFILDYLYYKKSSKVPPYFKVHTRTEIFRKISYFRSKHKRLFEKRN